MKKFLAMITVLSMGALSFGTATAYAREISESECDACFRVTMEELLKAENYDDTVIRAAKQTVYDIDENPLGYVYDFESDGNDGFAMIIYDDQSSAYTASEVYLEGENPYRNCEGTPVYVTAMTYWESDGQAYSDLLTGEQVPDSVVQSYAEIAYRNTYEGGAIVTGETVTVTYASREVDNYKMSLMYPSYLGGENIPNGCAAVAGGNILGYFDRYYDALIPNFTAGRFLGSAYLYYNETQEVEDAIDVLYADMGCTSEHGATIDTFKSGMATYCGRVGRSVAFTSCMSGSNFNYNYAIQKMQSGQPVALFLITYNYATLEEGTNVDYHHYSYSTGNHVMIGFGYKQIVYTLANGSTATYRLMHVASGLANLPTGYFNTNLNTNINDSYAVNIT